jgi:hypothetical protein
MRNAYVVLGPILFYHGARNRWPSVPDAIGIVGGRHYRRAFWRVFFRTAHPVEALTYTSNARIRR